MAVDWSDDEDEHDYGAHPDSVKRRPTDCLCGLLFLAALAGQAVVFHYGIRNGDPSKLAHLPTKSGDFCGLSSSVEAQPYLYFCTNANGTLSYTESVCTDDCATPACTGARPAPYKGKPFAGMLCLPDLKTAPALAKQQLQSLFADHPEVAQLLEIEGVFKAKWVLVGAGLTALVASYLFLCLVKTFAKCFIWLGAIALVAAPAILGGTVLYASKQPGGLDGLPSTGDAQQDLNAAYVALGVSALGVVVLCCLRSSLNQALTSIESAAEAIAAVPSLLVEPLFALVLKGAVFCGLLVGSAWLLSTGEGFTVSANGLDVKYTQEQKALIAYYFVVSVWMVEFCSALSTFVIAYTTQLWFYKRGTACAIVRAYSTALVYHIGTLAFGSLVISVTRVIRMALQVLIEATADTGNPIGRIVATVCCCIVGCFEQFLKFLNKFAYMDVAINSNSFCTAAKHALAVITHDATSTATVVGATAVVEFAGAGGISAAAGLVAYTSATHLDLFSNPESPHFVQNPLALTGVAVALGLLVALPFMMVFSTVADTTLFCFALHHQRTPVEDQKPKGFVSSCTVCWGKKAPARRPDYDYAQHPQGTQALLSRAS